MLWLCATGELVRRISTHQPAVRVDAEALSRCQINQIYSQNQPNYIIVTKVLVIAIFELIECLQYIHKFFVNISKFLPINMLPNSESKKIGLIWWNIFDFYHFDSTKINKGSDSRWPNTADDYKEKCLRVDAVFKDAYAKLGTLDVICICEITKIAATDLRNRLFPTYEVISLDVSYGNPTLQVAILHAPNSVDFKVFEQLPLTVENTNRRSRPMAVIDLITKNDTIRFIACHWQARIDQEGSEDQRYENATRLAQYSYSFLENDKTHRHIIIVGDLNEEPHERSLRRLNAHRHRTRSLSSEHYTDTDLKRVHLYNATWRLLGEKHAHPRNLHAITDENVAGTYFLESKGTWHNYDQIIVSGGLLTESLPCFDENELSILSGSTLLTNGLPKKFTVTKSGYEGLSDHLPIIASIYL